MRGEVATSRTEAEGNRNFGEGLINSFKYFTLNFYNLIFIFIK